MTGPLVAVTALAAVAASGCSHKAAEAEATRLEILAQQLEATDVVRNPPAARYVTSRTTSRSEVDPYFRADTSPSVRLSYAETLPGGVTAIVDTLERRGWQRESGTGDPTTLVKRVGGHCLVAVAAKATAALPVRLGIGADDSHARCARL